MAEQPQHAVLFTTDQSLQNTVSSMLHQNSTPTRGQRNLILHVVNDLNLGLEKMLPQTADVFLYDLSDVEPFNVRSLANLLKAMPEKPVIAIVNNTNPKIEEYARTLGVHDIIYRKTMVEELLNRSVHYAIEHRKAQNLLRVSAELYSHTLDTMDDVALIANNRGQITSVIGDAANMFGYTRDEILAFNDVNKFLGNESIPLNSGETGQFEVEFRGNDRLLKIISVSLKPIGVGGAAQLFLCHDITEYKAIEQALLESEERLQSVTSTAQHAIFTINAEGNISNWNRGAAEMFGYDEAEILGQSVSKIMPDQDHRNFQLRLRSASTKNKKGFLGSHEMYGLKKDGSEFQLDIAISTWESNKQVHYTSIVRDMTNKRMLEREIIEISEREQIRIGQNLHDGLGQLLTGIKFMLNLLEKNLSTKNLVEAETAAAIGEHINDAIVQTKTLARELYPVDLETNGIVSALGEFANSVEQTYGIGCTIISDEHVLILDHSVATHLYRITQEAVNNAIKHSHCAEIVITLKLKKEKLALTIVDDGIGIKIDPAQPITGVGMHTMKYRARMIGAQLSFNEARPHGTVVKCNIKKI